HLSVANVTSMWPITTGFPTVDAALGGLITGDNVVWISDDPQLYATLARRFVEAARAAADIPGDARVLYVDFGAHMFDADHAVDRLDAGPGTELRSTAALADELERRVRHHPPAALVIDPLAR